MSDIGIMDYFLTKNEIKVDPDMDIPLNYENADLMTSDFFDSILNLEKTNLDECELDSGLFNNIEVDMNVTSDESVTYDDMQCETSTFSDSGLSSDLQEMPDQILSDDELLKSIFDATPQTVSEKQLSQPISDVTKPVEYVRPFIAPAVTEPEMEKQKIINIIKPKQVIRVQPLNGNSRSVLLPINIKDLKTIKIINTNNLKAENIKFTSTIRQNKKSGNEKFIIKPSTKNGSIDELSNNTGIQRRHKQTNPSSPESTTTTTSTTADDVSASEEDTHGSQYPLLLLTAEEKRLLSKDGIQLPCRYPLTKHEERELKRIRRKIRNKISAQDSRKRKKEYVDGLEERVKQCSEENRSLVKRIKLLQLQNNKLSSQLSKLQALVFKTGTSRAHPATCLMIVLLSVMLVTLPNLRNNNNNNNSAVDKQLNSLQQYVARRALLFSQQATNEDTVSLNMDEFITFPAKNKMDDDEEIVDLVNGSTTYSSGGGNNKESTKLNLIDESTHSLQMPVIKYEPHHHHHHHIGVNVVDDDRGGGGGGRENDDSYSSHGIKRYIEPDIDDHWPPAKKRNVSSVTATGHINRTTEFYE